MPDLLVELFSEEIPARMQAQAAKDLQRIVVGALEEHGLKCETAKAFAGSRRLTLSLAGLPAKQPDVHTERKGPRVSAPQKAVDGFLRSAGLTLDQCQKRDDGKGEFYVAVIEKKGRATAEVLAEILPECFAKLPWPKSMRFPGSDVRWVRPLHSILCVFDGHTVPFAFAGIESGDTTRGHRFLAPGEIHATALDDYLAGLMEAHVMMDGEKRKAVILNDARGKAKSAGLELIEDKGLLEEVSGIAEWPVVLMGSFDQAFLGVPPEILQTSMRVNQKYFALRDPKTGKLANRFLVVANMVASDGGKEIVAGNERVLRARLADAKFFWDQDRKTKLADRVEALKGIVFHAKLGTQYGRVQRIVALAGEIAAKIDADVTKAKRAALLCKADLTTGVVGEFPELQGIMGGYYAAHDGEDPDVAAAIRDHYKPLGPTDSVPTAKVSIAVALADKLDQLTGFFAVGEKPTGSTDPFALRRAGLGIIRIMLENNIRLNLYSLTLVSYELYLKDAENENRLFYYDGEEPESYDSSEQLIVSGLPDNWPSEKERKPFVMYGGFRNIYTGEDDEIQTEEQEENGPYRWPLSKDIKNEIVTFFADRLKVALKEKGIRHDLIDAVFSLGGEDDLVRLVARVEALQDFIGTENGKNLLAAYKRAANILKAEEKKDKKTYGGAPDTTLLNLPEEKELAVDLQAAAQSVKVELMAERFVEAMRAMARLRKPVDAFFDKVTVNDKDPAMRENRLKLLSALRTTMHLAADFSKIEG